jgi:SRSO17 transposase
MAGILEHPEALELLEAASITAAEVNGCRRRLTSFLQRFLPLFQRAEQRQNATIVVEGKLTGLTRKTCEPIANQAGVHRKPIQSFVGCAPWDDEAVMAEIRHDVKREWADANASLILDSSGFPKKGVESCGVQRQWCGRLGKVENCQVGVFLVYACKYGHAPLDRRLFLPKEWAQDTVRRDKTHVPKEIVYQERCEIADDLLKRAHDLPHAWVLGDDEFGRDSDFRAKLRQDGERYLLDVPCNTLVRDLEVPAPLRKPGQGGTAAKTPFVHAEVWAAAQPAMRWQRFEVRAGEKGPLLVDAMEVRVQTMLGKCVCQEDERLVVQRTVATEPEISYHLSNAGWGVPLREVVGARSERPRVEQVFHEGKGEVGLGHYEVRGWTGWHHHMTLSLLALWFLALERRRVGGEKDGPDGIATARGVHPLAASSPTDGSADCRRDQPRSAASGGSANLPLVQFHQNLSATA